LYQVIIQPNAKPPQSLHISDVSCHFISTACQEKSVQDKRHICEPVWQLSWSGVRTRRVRSDRAMTESSEDFPRSRTCRRPPAHTRSALSTEKNGGDNCDDISSAWTATVCTVNEY